MTMRWRGAHSAAMDRSYAALTLVHIVLGSLALQRGCSAKLRRCSDAAALATCAFMASVALHHHPLGLFSE